jgi:hypothetical protein
MIKESPATLPIVLLSPIAPVITLVNYLLEVRFVKKWAPQVLPALGEYQVPMEDAIEEVAA